MLSQLLPRHVDNTYHGYKLALWFFGLVVFMKVSMSLHAIFNGHFVASSADGIPLDTFTPAGSQAVVSLFAAWGLSQRRLPTFLRLWKVFVAVVGESRATRKQSNWTKNGFQETEA
jgi:hypothetical protein